MDDDGFHHRNTTKEFVFYLDLLGVVDVDGIVDVDVDGKGCISSDGKPTDDEPGGDEPNDNKPGDDEPSVEYSGISGDVRSRMSPLLADLVCVVVCKVKINLLTFSSCSSRV